MSQIVTYNGIVGYLLEKRRNELGYDQAKVAHAAGISQPVLSRLEKGGASITIDQLFPICTALSISPGTIIQIAEQNANVLTKDDAVDVMTTKQSSSADTDNGSKTNAVLAGAAIGVVLAMLLK